MPKEYTDLQKRDALDWLDIYDNNISMVHSRTGIPERTLRRWRAEREQERKQLMTEKDIETDIKRSYNDDASPIDSPSTEDEPAASDREDFSYIRGHLMRYARELAADLRPADIDSNLRTLTLSRILDRIERLDNILIDKATEFVTRFEYYYDGAVQPHPPWANASAKEDPEDQEASAEQTDSDDLKTAPWADQDTYEEQTDSDDLKTAPQTDQGDYAEQTDKKYDIFG